VNTRQTGPLSSNGRTFSIRPSAREDVPEIHALIRELAEYEQLTQLFVATQQDVTEALFGARPVAEALIATVDAESPVMCGFALFFHTYSTFLGRKTLWLEDLFVRPAFRGRGVGAAFLGELAGLAVERNCGRFEWAVLEWNRPAIAFYESVGAAILPDWRIARVTGSALQRLANR
jgi:GNAT superfamily N-acetyltransferase